MPITTASNDLDYRVEYIDFLIQSASPDGLIQWERYFNQFFDDGNLGYCRKLLTRVKSASLDAYGRGIVWLREGDLYEFTGNTRMAFSSYNSCLHAFTAAEISVTDRNKWISEVLGKLVNLEKKTGNYVEARRLLDLQLKIYEAEGVKRKKQAVLGDLADLAILQEDYEGAIEFLSNKLDHARELSAFGDQLDITLKLAPLYQQIGDVNNVNLFCQRAIELAKEMNYQPAIITALELQASIKIKQNQYDEAHKIYRTALDKALDGSNKVKAKEIQEQLDKLEKMTTKQIFISYSHHDRDFVERLVKDIKAAGFSVWWDELEIKVGHSIIRKVFGEGIRKATYLAVVLSPNSIKSRFVQRELETALMSQLSSRKITVLPLLIADCKIPDFLKVIKWADFRNAYESGFTELLRTIGQTQD